MAALQIAGGRLARMGSRASSGVIQLQLDEKAVARVLAKLDEFKDAPLNVRINKATKAAAELLVTPIRAAAPRGKAGSLRRSVSARTVKNRDKAAVAGFYNKATGGDRVGLAGPRSPVRHLIIRGHRIVTHSGIDTGRRTEANPFVDNVAKRHQQRAMDLMRQYIVTAGLDAGLGNALIFGRRKR